MATPVSAVILTKNEAAFIGRCVRSCHWADEVVVLDSGSTDDTREIARSCGAVVFEREWHGWAKQRNMAISLASNDWVFYLDADEIVTPELGESVRKAMHEVLHDDDGFYFDRRGDFLGILLPNVSRSRNKKGFIRLFNRKCNAFDESMTVHEECHIKGRALPLNGALLHWRGYTMEDYFPLFNRYATLEAAALRQHGIRATPFSLVSRPVLRFLWLYIYKQEFRLGTRGLIHSLLKATSEFMRYAKLWEMDHAVLQQDPPVEIYSEQRLPSSRRQEAETSPR